VSREINPWKSFDLLRGSNLRPLAPSAGCLTARPPELTPQRVVVHGILSDIQLLLFGVPHDSVFDSLVFTMNTRPRGITAPWYGAKYHF